MFARTISARHRYLTLATIGLMIVAVGVAAWFQQQRQDSACLTTMVAEHRLVFGNTYRPPKTQQAQIAEVDDRQVAAAGSQVLAATSLHLSTPMSPSPTPIIGIYDTASPSDPSSLTRLDEIASGGFNTVLNYTAWDGNAQQIGAYLDHAHALGLGIIFSLKDFYDIEPQQQVPLSDVAQWGSSYDAVTANLVTTFRNYPGLAGWYLSDERPEVASDLPTWLPALRHRYQQVKQLDPTHPTLMVQACYPGQYLGDTAALTQLKTTTDQLGFDTYPVPYNPLTQLTAGASTLSQVVTNPQQRLYVIQDFSWTSYPEVPKGQGEDLSQARYPTQAELQEMVRRVQDQGVPNVLFYSYFDLKNDAAHFATNWHDLTTVVRQLRQ